MLEAQEKRNTIICADCGRLCVIPILQNEGTTIEHWPLCICHIDEKSKMWFPFEDKR